MNTNVYLRHAKTRSYYSGWHCWTDDVQRATNFESPDSAFQKAREEQMNQVEVVIQDGNYGKETVVPIIRPI